MCRHPVNSLYREHVSQFCNVFLVKISLVSGPYCPSKVAILHEDESATGEGIVKLLHNWLTIHFGPLGERFKENNWFGLMWNFWFLGWCGEVVFFLLQCISTVESELWLVQHSQIDNTCKKVLSAQQPLYIPSSQPSSILENDTILGTSNGKTKINLQHSPSIDFVCKLAFLLTVKTLKLPSRTQVPKSPPNI
jgi:hypothetical protein